MLKVFTLQKNLKTTVKYENHFLSSLLYFSPNRASNVLETLNIEI